MYIFMNCDYNVRYCKATKSSTVPSPGTESLRRLLQAALMQHRLMQIKFPHTAVCLCQSSVQFGTPEPVAARAPVH